MVRFLKENDSIRLFDDLILNVIETPGHSPCSLSYFNDNFIFTGDSYIPGAPVVTKLPRGNKELASKSVKKILSLAKDRTILSGHDIDKWISPI